ncbi:MAG: hypothetical protein A4E32_00859 [Methanomassiliicoccales archaeon PtaU1.Bin124]|nr:MAG: hypothetical protein A4E32_00859 [Methanomassiliicoccales archaeon PtaU1.Bin124]
MEVNTDAVKELIGKRGLKVADIEDVIKTAESSGKKFTKKGTNLNMASKRIGDVTVYAVYELESGILKKKAVVKSAYSHRVKLNKVDHLAEESEWMMGNSPVHNATLNLEYMTVVRSGPGLASADGSVMMVEEYLATKTLAAAEGLFEKKRA